MAILIEQARKLPIINGFVIVPDIPFNRRVNINLALATITGSSLSEFFINEQQRFFVLPNFDRSTGFPEDWFAQLRDVGTL